MKRNCLLCLALYALLLAGCGMEGTSSSGGPVSSAPEPVPSEGGFQVQMDWSRLEGERLDATPDVDGGRWYPDYTDHLITGPDYGPLIPYRGASAYSVNRWVDNTGETQEYWSDWPILYCGLMTREGKIVVDPVYQSATLYTYRFQGKDLALPVLLLSRSDPAWKDSGGSRYAAAAEDGSWITDFEFTNYTNRGGELLLVGPKGLTRLDSATGARADWTWADLGVPAEDVTDALDMIQWAIGLTWLDQGVCVGTDPDTGQYWMFQPETGEVFWVDSGQWDTWISVYYDQRWGDHWELTQEETQVTLTRGDERYVIPDVLPVCYDYPEVRDGRAILESGEGYQLHRLSDGALLLEGTYIQFVSDPVRSEGLSCVEVQDGKRSTLYDGSLTPVLTLPTNGEYGWIWFQLWDGLLSCYDDSGTWFGCWDLDAGACIFYRNLYPGD